MCIRHKTSEFIRFHPHPAAAPFISRLGVCMEVRQLWLCSGHPSWLSPLWGSFLFSLQPASTAPRSPPSSARSSTAADGRSSSHLFGTQRLARVEGKEKYPPVILIRPKMRHRGRIVIHIYFLLFFPPVGSKGLAPVGVKIALHLHYFLPYRIPARLRLTRSRLEEPVAG